MTTRACQSPKFDAFLFAPVGEDGKGMMVSVLSALARLGFDPWAEAETLSQLPEDAARARLDSLLVALQDVPAVTPDHRSIVARLVTLLPRSSTIKPAGRKEVRLDPSAIRKQSGLWLLIILVVVIGQTLALQQKAGPPVDGTPGFSAGAAPPAGDGNKADASTVAY